MLSIKGCIYVLFIFISLYYPTKRSALNTAGAQKALKKMKCRSNSVTLVPERAWKKRFSRYLWVRVCSLEVWNCMSRVSRCPNLCTQWPLEIFSAQPLHPCVGSWAATILLIEVASEITIYFLVAWILLSE